MVKYASAGFLLGSLFLYFFYHTGYVVIAGIPCGIVCCQWVRKVKGEQRRQHLAQQFKDWISGVSSQLKAGFSVENAFCRAGRELGLLYGEDADIRREVRSMERLLENNVTLEKILYDLGQRSGVEDISIFAEVFMVGKRSGGDLREMIEASCEIITMKANVEDEIRTLLHGRVMEQKIMCLIPFGITGYISLSSPGYFAALYHNLAGGCIMTGCLLVYLLSVWMSQKITHIEV